LRLCGKINQLISYSNINFINKTAMKKIYKHLIFGALVLSATGVAAEEVTSYTLYDLTAAALSRAYIDTEGNSFVISHNDPGGGSGKGDMIFTNTVANPLRYASPAEAAPSGAYAVAQIKGASNANTITNTPWILITFPKTTATAGITRIDVMGIGVASTNVEIVYAWTPTLNPTINNFEDAGADGNMWAWTSASGSQKTIPVPVGVTAVAIAYSNQNTAFAGWGATSIPAGAALNVEAIRFYAHYNDAAHQGTGIDKALVAKTPVSSSYYDLTGKAVSPDVKGFVIRKIIYSDGSVANEKAYNR
jgi:hypothetical protein